MPRDPIGGRIALPETAGVYGRATESFRKEQDVAGKLIIQKGKAVNMGPLRGNNSFPLGNKARPNTSGQGGGGAAGDGTGLAAAKVVRDDKAAKGTQKGNGKGKKAA